MNKKVKVLCTGAAGFIGSHLCRALKRKNYETTCLVHPSDDTRGLDIMDVLIIRADLNDKKSLYPVVSDYSYIFHLAGVLSSPDPEKFYRVNFFGTRNLVEVFLESRCVPERFLFTSSISAAGPSLKNSPLNEESLCCPVSHYGRSKLLAEQYLRSLSESLPLTIVRLPLVYGPGSQGGLYPFFKTINKGFCISAGHAETSLAFVGDVVRGIILAAESRATLGKTYFLGEERRYSSEEIFRIIEEALGKRALKMKIPYPVISFIALILEAYAKIKKSAPIVTREELKEYLRFHYWLATTRRAHSDFEYETEFGFEVGARVTAERYRRDGFI